MPFIPEVYETIARRYLGNFIDNCAFVSLDYLETRGVRDLDLFKDVRKYWEKARGKCIELSMSTMAIKSVFGISIINFISK
jgi:hypothetical protein